MVRAQLPVHPAGRLATHPGALGPTVRLLAVSLLLLVSACSVIGPQRTVRGNRIDDDQLKELTVGTSTRADAASLLGTPTARATFDDNTWIYIHEVTEPRIGRTPGVLEQDVVLLGFDGNGVLRRVKRVTQDDAQPVQVVSRTTPSPGGEATFIQQLIGNIGKFNPAGGLGGGSGLQTGSNQ